MIKLHLVMGSIKGFTLPSVILDNEVDDLQKLLGDRYLCDAMTDQVLIIDTIRDAALTTFAHVVGLDASTDLYSELYDEFCIVASYDAEADPMGDMMGRNV